MKHSINRITLSYFDDKTKVLTIYRKKKKAKKYIVKNNRISVLKLMILLSKLQREEILTYTMENRALSGNIFNIQYKEL